MYVYVCLLRNLIHFGGDVYMRSLCVQWIRMSTNNSLSLYSFVFTINLKCNSLAQKLKVEFNEVYLCVHVCLAIRYVVYSSVCQVSHDLFFTYNQIWSKKENTFYGINRYETNLELKNEKTKKKFQKEENSFSQFHRIFCCCSIIICWIHVSGSMLFRLKS